MSHAVYLLNILKNHTVHACEGGTLSIDCPSKTSVSVLSAFYGRRVPNQHLCPAGNSNQTVEEDNECSSPVAVEVHTQKTMIEEGQNSTVFSVVAESCVGVSGPPLLPHPRLQPGVWTGPLSSHHQVPTGCLQVQTRYVAQVVKTD